MTVGILFLLAVARGICDAAALQIVQSEAMFLKEKGDRKKGIYFVPPPEMGLCC
ncbi:hypothetical protein [Pseudomonas huaxiensis]|uniref:hypothetical protein n=1 Tax=Pseudomonas huaxiensis TaxID=2213017 RepID=UPI0013002A59